MNSPILDVHFTFTMSATGQVVNIDIDWEDLYSLTPPYQPAILNVGNTGKISARNWRHVETGWYHEEHAFLTQLLRNRRDLAKVVAESRLLLYAVFVKAADGLGDMTLRKRSSKRFVNQYRTFCDEWRCHPSLPRALWSGNLPANPEDYLKAVHPGSYAELRRILEMLA